MGLCNEYIDKMKEGREDDYALDWALYKVVYRDDIKKCHCGEPATWLAEIYPDEPDQDVKEIWWCNDCI